ncbi:glutamate--tRNA ligase [Murdochiella vaginalis]|uniref:glutamate--tRNA ligase n=1 Tax=Murdochiella vaginalis TaxID=1852373 RepID=UPI0008FDD973|nr:glutamate--tRNA ligase [Murdochiella vaginalis]
MSQVHVRFAPSPTGYLHIGGLRTALFNYLYARHHGGRFILRIEDTDRTRFVPDALENLLRVLHWAGLENDEGPFLDGDHISEKGEHGPYIQSHRHEQGLYRRYAEQLIEKGQAYYCFCSKERLDAVRDAMKERGETPRYDGHCRDLSPEEVQKHLDAGEEYVIRMKLPRNRDITFHDAIKGDITFNTDELDDQVLIKSDGFPTYHFAVVLDDHLMGVTHIVRGEEWISSTPKHVLLYQNFGWEEPTYVHLPTVLGEDHKKLSKRNGDAAVEQYIAKGYLPEALINYIALLGWSPKGNEEILSREELIQEFDFDRISSTGGIFDVKKLNWMNGEYIKAMPVDKVVQAMRPFLEKEGLIDEHTDDEKLYRVAALYQNRVEYFQQFPDLTRHLFVTADALVYEEDAKAVLSTPEAKALVTLFADKVRAESSMTEEFANSVVKTIQTETGIKGKNLWFPIRAAVVGATSGPDFGQTLLILGRDEVLARLERTLAGKENA